MHSTTRHVLLGTLTVSHPGTQVFDKPCKKAREFLGYFQERICTKSGGSSLFFHVFQVEALVPK